MWFRCRYSSYCSDLQRTFYVLRPTEPAAHRKVQKAFNDMVNAVEQAKQAIYPGKQGIELMQLPAIL